MSQFNELISGKEAVIFDMDGTLVDNMKIHDQVWLSLFEKYELGVTEERYHANGHGNMREMITRFFGEGLSDEEIQFYGQEKETLYRQLYAPHLNEVNGVSQFLQKLKLHNIKIGLATLSDATNIQFILNGLDIRSYFDFVIGGHQITKGKPNPEIFHKSLEGLSVNAEKSIIFEDSISGIKGGIAAGIDVIGITTTFDKDFCLSLGCLAAIGDYQELL
jgi:beta-phosphoglucomutase